MPEPDRRTERTRTALSSAFIQMLLAEGYEAVTVERIAERANVGRSTFYMHYTGKEAVLRESMKNPSSVLAAMVGNLVPADIVTKQLEHFHEQRRLNHIFFAGPVRAIWVRCLAELIEPRVAAVARHAGARPLLPVPLIALQLADSQIALVANWLTARPSARAETVAQAMIGSTQALLAVLLGCRADRSLVIPGEKLRLRTT